MRILFLSTWHPSPADNGSKIRVLHLLRAMGERHAVSLVSFSFGTAQTAASMELDELCRTVDTVEIDPFAVNRASTVRRFLSAAPVVTRPVDQMRAVTRRLLSEKEFDVVVASGAVMEKYAMEAKAGTVRILEQHSSLSRVMRDRYEGGRSLKDRWRYWLSWQKTKRYERELFGRFDLVTLVSEQDRAYTERHVSKRRGHVKVIPNGVDCERNVVNGARDHRRGLIYNGAMTYRANYDAVSYFLREIYPRVKAATPDVSLKVTGSTRGVPLDGLALDDSVTLTGYVDDIRPEVAGSAVCVVPLREGGGTRLKILEAMALGTPVVSTSKGAEGLAVEAGEHLLIADEPGQFAWETVRLLSDWALQGKLAANARRLVEERYDWRQLGWEYARLVEQTVADKR